MNLCSEGCSFGEVFGFASICVFDTSPASLPFSLSSEKKIDWEWAARSVHWGRWWSGCHDPPSSMQKTWRASMTWTLTPTMAGQVGGGICLWALDWRFSRRGLHSCFCFLPRLAVPVTESTGTPEGRGQQTALGPERSLLVPLPAVASSRSHVVCLGLSSYSWREKEFL